MPNRIIRDWTDSFTMDELDANSERFFVRLIMKVDDYGRFHSDARILKSNLFPLKTDIRETDITRWLAACENSGLITVYTIANKSYLQIENFKQTLRQKNEKYPAPTTDDAHVHSRCIADANAKRKETETEKNLDTGQPTASKKSFSTLTESEFKHSLVEFVPEFGKHTVRSFFDYWSEKDSKGKMRFQLQKTWDSKKRLNTWKNNEGKFGNNIPTQQSKNTRPAGVWDV